MLINYDMPWNPMRVEQRIGRIGRIVRIGQTFETVWIRNYFYADTVEAVIYQRLDDRIGWFVNVVGELQPILHKIGRTIEEVAMLPAEKRAKKRPNRRPRDGCTTYEPPDDRSARSRAS